MANPVNKPQTVCIHIPPSARTGEIVTQGGPKRFVSKPPARTAMPVMGSLGVDTASYKEFFQSLYDAAVLTGVHGEILDSNARAHEFFQLESEELSAMFITDLISGADQSLLDAIRQNFENESTTYIEAYCLRKDGTAFPAEIIVNKLKYVKTGAYCFFVRDATRRKQAEETLAAERNLLRTLIDSLPDFIYVKDSECRYLLDNIAHRKFVQAESSADIFGKTVFDFFPSELAQQMFEEDQQILQTGQPVVEREELLPNSNLDPIWVSTSKMPLPDAYGKVAGIVGIGRDVTSYKLNDQKLRSAAEKLEKSNRELQDFAYIASHDLQEPLRKIQAFGDRLKAKMGDSMTGDGADYLLRMQNAAGRMQVLINNLLTLSRITTKAQPFVTVDLNQLIQEVISDLEVRVEQTGGKVIVDGLPSLEADPIQMHQLFQNLIANALKFHKTDTPPVIQIRSILLNEIPPAVRYSPQGCCEIVIQDNGIGFDSKYSESIFAPFQRLHGREEYEGTGIGLAICRKIVERHGGVIYADSLPGQGTTFTITLPLTHTPEP